MFELETNATTKRAELRNGLRSGRLLQFPGAFNALIAMLIEERSFDGVYVSGAGIAADLGLPDIGLTTQSEVVTRSHQIARSTSLPTFIDIDTGFGGPMNAARTIEVIEAAGIAACHIEDQVDPKRCGHLDGKAIVDVQTMVQKLKAATSARRDANLVICARTDARSVEGLNEAINRAKAYVDAGADMIFPEALTDASEFEQFRRAVDVPLLANMTEFGKSDLLSKETLESLGINVVIYPMTLFRLAMRMAEEGLDTIRDEGSQRSLVNNMQTRSRLYELLRYESYNAFDQDVFNFTLDS